MKIHKKLNLVSVQRELREREMDVFTPKEFERVFGVADTAARQFIAYYTKKHFFSKLRNGLYSLEGQRPNLYFAANKLYRPSYVSLETALFLYGILPETVYSITSVTSRRTREFEAFGIAFRYVRIKQEAFGGYSPKREGNCTVLVADPEKALMDYLYIVSLGKRMLNDRLNLRNVDVEKARAYIPLFGRSNLKAIFEKALALPEPEIR